MRDMLTRSLPSTSVYVKLFDSSHGAFGLYMYILVSAYVLSCVSVYVFVHVHEGLRMTFDTGGTISTKQTMCLNVCANVCVYV